MPSITSWIYVFSKFTPEALLFEALLISMLCASYAAYWVMRTRRYGAIENSVPPGIVKGYLNELIVDAERMRAQLFGLLAGAGQPAAAFVAPVANLQIATGVDPELAKKLAALEAKMTEQAMALQAITQEKTRIEKELADARAAGLGAAGGTADAGLVAELERKIKILESKLAEYSVIEDDLANLKRLQQENAQLKAALAGKGGALAEVPANPPAAARAEEPRPAASVPPAQAAQDEPLGKGLLSDIPSAEATFGDIAEPAVAAPAVAADAASSDSLFEGLVDQVEKSLQPEPAAIAAASEPSTSAPAAGNIEKSDADLVAEFEKMLNG